MTGFLFLFKSVERDDISNKIRSLNATKSAQESDIPTKIICQKKKMKSYLQNS